MQIIKEFQKSYVLIGECLVKLNINHKRKFARNVLVMLFRFEKYLGDKDNRKIKNTFFDDDGSEVLKKVDWHLDEFDWTKD